jgi:hypothetical protein
MHRVSTIALCSILTSVVILLAGCNKEVPDAATPTQPAGKTSAANRPLALSDTPSTAWPSGDALTVSVPADAKAASMTKALYESGDVVIEQRWPDGTRERWWYPVNGKPRYVGRDGRETGVGANADTGARQ